MPGKGRLYVFWTLWFHAHLEMLICLCAPLWFGYRRNLIPHKAKWFQCPEKGGFETKSQLRSRLTLSLLSFSHIWLLKSHSQHPWQTMPKYKRAQRGRGQVCSLALQPAKSTTLCISGSFTHPVSNSRFSSGLGFHWHHLHCSEFSLQPLVYIFLDPEKWLQCLTHIWSQDWVIVL